MAVYELSRAADQDFENIFDFGINRFGFEQALAYQKGLKTRFIEIAEQPELYQSIECVRIGYRRSVYKAHSIYYKIDDKKVLIVRILGRQDLATALAD